MGLLCGAGEEEENREGAGGTSSPGCYGGKQDSVCLNVTVTRYWMSLYKIKVLHTPYRRIYTNPSEQYLEQ